MPLCLSELGFTFLGSAACLLEISSAQGRRSRSCDARVQGEQGAKAGAKTFAVRCVFACVLCTDGRSRALNRAHSGFGPLPCVFESGFWLAFTEDASAVSFTGNLRMALPCVCKHGRRCGPWKSLALFNLVEFWLFCWVFCLLVCLLACLFEMISCKPRMTFYLLCGP